MPLLLALLACTRGPPPAPDLVPVAPGAFLRGSATAANAGLTDGRQAVTVTRPFALGRFEVTQAEWEAVTGARPWETATRRGEGRDQGPCRVGGVGPTLPAYCVSWRDAVDFANALSARHGLAPAYELDGDAVRWDPSAPGYRLPTEAEWTLAARAGADLRYGVTDDPAGVCAHANVADRAAAAADPALEAAFPCDDGHPGLAPVGSLAPNAWGLHDLQGNVWEWTWDRYGPWGAGPVADPGGAEVGAERVAKGASWRSTAPYTEVDARIHGAPDTRGVRLGLRLAVTLTGDGPRGGAP